MLRADGTSLNDCAYYYERTPFGIYLRNKSKVSFVVAALHHDSLIPDTLYRIDMLLGNKQRSPYHDGSAVGGTANYYFGDVVAEEVKAYERAMYPNAWDSTDVHFYYGSAGPRMAIVMKPGANPADVKLAFTGQDSIKVDWQGHLRLYSGNRWIKLEQAFA